MSVKLKTWHWVAIATGVLLASVGVYYIKKTGKTKTADALPLPPAVVPQQNSKLEENAVTYVRENLPKQKDIVQTADDLLNGKLTAVDMYDKEKLAHHIGWWGHINSTVAKGDNINNSIVGNLLWSLWQAEPYSELSDSEKDNIRKTVRRKLNITLPTKDVYVTPTVEKTWLQTQVAAKFSALKQSLPANAVMGGTVSDAIALGTLKGKNYLVLRDIIANYPYTRG